MILASLLSRRASAGEPGRPGRHPERIGPVALLGLSAWCGTVAGLLEVVTVIVRKRFFDTNQLLGMSRHFIWLVPLTDLLVFAARRLGGISGRDPPARGWSLGGRASARRPDRAARAPRGLPAGLRPGLAPRRPGTIGPSGPDSGAARGRLPSRRPLEFADPRRHAGGSSRPCPGRPIRIQQWRERARPIPPEAPNVLLIVMDTVAADHLDLYGYTRPTSPALDELARRGSRFDAAQLVLLVDPRLAREHVHRAMASRAVGRLADPARRDLADGGRVPAFAGVCHGGLHRQHDVLRRRLGAGPWLHRLSRLHLPRALAVPRWR